MLAVILIILFITGAWYYLNSRGSYGKIVGAGQHCGGNGTEINVCGPGLYCAHTPGRDGTVIPDVAGICTLGTVPTPARTSSGPGEHCGGNMANPPVCGTGYHCAPSPGSNLPFGDVGGICVADEDK